MNRSSQPSPLPSFFEGWTGFDPDESSPFQDEFDRLSMSQGWSESQRRRHLPVALESELHRQFFTPIALLALQRDLGVIIKTETEDADESEDETLRGASSVTVLQTGDVRFEGSRAILFPPPGEQDLEEQLDSEVQFIRLAGWRNICQRIGVRHEDIPDTIKGCKREVRKRHVNIYNLINTARNGEELQVFESRKELARYSRATGGVYPKALAKQFRHQKVFLKRLGRVGRPTKAARQPNPAIQGRCGYMGRYRVDYGPNFLGPYEVGADYLGPYKVEV